MEYIVTIVSIVGSVASIIALIIQLRGQRESFKIYSLLTIILILITIASFSLANTLYLKKRNSDLVNEASITNQTIAIVNSIMLEIEKFNNMVTLPDGQEEESIHNFEYNIREAAEKLRELEERNRKSDE